MDEATAVLAEFADSTRICRTYSALSELSNIPASTLWHRAHGRPSKREKAEGQQYLTPAEEKALVAYLLRMSNNGFPIPVKFLRSLAVVIARQRSSSSREHVVDESIRPPGKNWPQGFYKRHPILKARRVKALDWNRHDKNIYDKVSHWFEVIGRELDDPVILPENVYNMDETGVLLSVLSSLKVLVGKDDLRAYRGAGVKRTLVTAIECISGDGRSLNPLIIWPAVTHRSTWTTHPTPGWHFACSKTGYTDSEISRYWIQHVFDPQTKEQAGRKPRILISDGFATHESLEVMQYCYENNIVLCRIPSHTSHKLQPCDVGVFGPLKSAYREQVEQLYRGGANTVGKQHFTLLYSRARDTAFTARNIKSGWSKTGLYPFNPDKVLKSIQRPQAELRIVNGPVQTEVESSLQVESLQTPVTSEALASLRTLIQQDAQVVDIQSKCRLQKLANAAEKAFAERALLIDENRLLFQQNDESKVRASTKATIVGKAKVMSYEDIVAAQAKRTAKRAGTSGGAPRGRKRKSVAAAPVAAKRPRGTKAGDCSCGIQSPALVDYRTELQL
jgi:hypothetical protein